MFVFADFEKLDKHGLREKAEKLQSFYPDDLEVTFGAELYDFQIRCKVKKIEGESAMNFLQFIRKKELVLENWPDSFRSLFIKILNLL